MSNANADLETVRQRLRDDVVLRYQTSDQSVPDPQGRWPDVDYAARDHADWAPIVHLERLRALVCGPNHSASAMSALTAWLAADPHSRNWWYNQLGVPIALGDVLLLMDGRLSDDQRSVGAERLSRAVWKDMYAQNLVWAAEANLRRGLLLRDPEIVADAVARIGSTLHISTDEGVQPDRSFHEHGPLLYFMGYGHDFLIDSARTAFLVSGTEFAFDEAKIAVVVDYLLDGVRWAIHRNVYDFTAMGRVVARRPAQDAWREIPAAIRHLLAIGTARDGELRELLDQLTMRTRVPGHRHFWRSDYTTHHRLRWSTSIRMCSARTAPTETGNGEGLLSWYLGEGINPIWVSGDEYRDIFPVWNWRRLPGLTAEQATGPLPELDWHRAPDGSTIRGGRNEVGGLAEGGYGFASMRLAKDRILDGRKSWFCFDDEFLALGAGIVAPDAQSPVWTTIDQCRNQGEPTRHTDPAGWQWIHHGQIWYAVAPGTDLITRSETQEGSWSRIAAAQSPEPVRLPVTTVAIDHGPAPDGAAYAYLVAPAPERPSPVPVTIIRNDPAVQAVRHDALDIVQAAFHEPGAAAGIEVDAPALVQVRAGVVSVADHTRRGGSVTVTVAGGTTTVEFPDGDRSGATRRIG